MQKTRRFEYTTCSDHMTISNSICLIGCIQLSKQEKIVDGVDLEVENMSLPTLRESLWSLRSHYIELRERWLNKCDNSNRVEKRVEAPQSSLSKAFLTWRLYEWRTPIRRCDGSKTFLRKKECLFEKKDKNTINIFL